MKTFRFLLLVLSLFPATTFAIIITGKVTDSKNNPLPFTSVFIKGTTTGTTSNQEGNYKIDVPVGMQIIVFKFIGYKQLEKRVEVGSERLILNVTLEEERYELKEAVVKANAEDPAYPIMRNAIAKRKFYLEQVDAFSCDVYIKGMQRLTKYPSKILGQKVDLSEVIDSTTGVVYLSESVSKLYFQKPDNEKEIMVSSKVSGSNNSFSFNRASDMRFNFYNNIVGEGGLSMRGFISPVAGNAMFYYKYKLIGSFDESGKTIHKIEVLPKREHDPVFRGYIFIQDSAWRIHSTDLYLTKDAQMQFLDTMYVKEQYTPVAENDDIWMPVSMKFYFVFGVLGFEGNGIYNGVLSNYQINPVFEKGFFGGEVVHVDEGSNKKDSAYWDAVRPVPLTEMESNDYHKKDSLQVIRESKPYMDSVDRKNNKPKIQGLLLSGYNYSNSYKKYDLNFSSLLQAANFNTVEGLNIGLSVIYTKTYEKRKKLSLSGAARYTFELKDIYGNASVSYLYSIFKSSQLTLSGGHDAVQFNEFVPITTFLNTGYSLSVEKNYMKIYEKNFGKIQYKTEVINGFKITAEAEYADRLPLVNTTDYSWYQKSETSRYTSNDPLNPENNDPSFERNQSLVASILFRIRFKQKYYSDPETHYILGSKYPTIYAKYKKGFKNILGSDVDYDYVVAGFEDAVSLGMFGRLSYNAVYGNFINHNTLGVMDMKHFNGNQTIFSEFRLNDFQQLEYYKYSTYNEFYEVHVSHNFNGFFFNKIPGLRKAFLSEVVSANYLHTLDGDHFEFGIGIEKLRVLRFDVVSAVAKGSKPVVGIRFGTRIIGLLD